MLSVDTVKSFNRVAWDYMHASLHALGLRASMRAFISALYNNPTPKVHVNGTLSEAFSNTNDTRQGCPLSPLIYILTLEPLMQRLRENPDIRSINIGSREYKTAAFADVLLFLSNPLVSLPALIKDF